MLPTDDTSPIACQPQPLTIEQIHPGSPILSQDCLSPACPFSCFEVGPARVEFTKTFFSEAAAKDKIKTLRAACNAHVKLTKECSQGLGQDRHLYALYCLIHREMNSAPPSPTVSEDGTSTKSNQVELPAIFSDPGWSLLNTSILSTSNCSNPALRLFGFGPVAADGFGIGYIIKDEGISVCATSKHLQTRRHFDTVLITQILPYY
ncbi:hypothetical protein FS749_005450 [Ceratobasidium sp. UAMH 11750]|nr:hypothetical protein FS749_005450 [Ceratobasidium sp. UAMH 11750]